MSLGNPIEFDCECMMSGEEVTKDRKTGWLDRLIITKRMLGIALIALGMVIVIGTFAVDLFGVGKWGGIGPSQRLAIAGGVLIALVGATLIPLGDRPA
jgi:hypothetical protein